MHSRKQAICLACRFANPFDFRFCGNCGAPLQSRASPAVPLHDARASAESERRQITVLFCDLAGSSMLTTHLGPEAQHELIKSYQDACTLMIQRFEGTVSRLIGDAILALFGYPQAHEDDAERAVRAGLEIISAVRTVPLPAAMGDKVLEVRVAIATGLVVVGDIIGKGAAEQMAVTGDPPNLASRLQEHAPPNAVLIAPGTRALIGERFEYEDLGKRVLKGFAAPVQICRVIAPRSVESRFEAAHAARRTPLLDRKEHVAWLSRRWREAEQWRGEAVMLFGEAGIGKSRVVEGLRERISSKPYETMWFQCSEHYSNTALHPIIEHIERKAEISGEHTAREKLARLRTWLGECNAPDDDAAPVLGTLLSIPAHEGNPAPAMSPQRQKERTFELLLGYMERVSMEWPLLVVFEDLHWVDPTTEEFLKLLTARVRDMRVLVVMTTRPDYSPSWPSHAPVESQALTGLAAEYATALAKQVAAGHLPDAVIGQVVARTDGVPLFIEELTRAVVEGAAAEQRAEYMPHAPQPLSAIPPALSDTLMARLDKLGPAKHIAQVASAIGREFSFDLLEAVVDRSADLRGGLRALEDSGLVYSPGVAGPNHAFKHALVQVAAYDSLLRARRCELHRRIAEALENRFPRTARDTPELVAHHWTEAGIAESAVASWLAAGRRASERSEHREAIARLRRGLKLIPGIADKGERRARELELLLVLGPALITTEGGGAQEVGALYTRALELCTGTPECAPHFAAYWGWWRASMDLRKGREWADKLLALARTLDQRALLLQGHHCQWATLYMLGAHAECCRHIEAGLALYDRDEHHAHAATYGGHDARVCALGELAVARWLLGHPDEALGHVKEALAWANELRHVGSRAHAMDYALVLHKFRRDAAAVLKCADELVVFASEQHLRDHCAKGAFFRGWARAMLHDMNGGVQEMQRGMAAFQGVGTPEDVSVYYEMLAEVYTRGGRYEDGLRAVEDAFAQTDRCGILFWNPELHRRRGELLLASGDSAAAAACFEEALTCARAQQARSLELRSALSLARLLHGQDSLEAARATLRPIYERFDEGFDTPDLVEARQLLESAA